jgi:hypothetical protein
MGRGEDVLRFRSWLDTRAVPFPGDPDRTNDTVGRLDDLTQNGLPCIVAVEFQSRPDPDMFGRMLNYLSGLWLACRPDEERGSRFQLGAAVVNLTGHGVASQRMERTNPDMVVELRAVERNLEGESADELLAGVESGRWSRHLLPWVPLMAGADNPDLIDRWKRLAETEPDRRRRANLSVLAGIFADRANRKDLWAESLRRWDVEESTFFNELVATALARREARGEARGMVEGARNTLLRQGKKKFGPASAGVEAAIIAITDHTQLEQIAERVLDATSWEELLATP